MHQSLPRFSGALQRTRVVLMTACVLAASLVLFLRLLIHFPFYDECSHAHSLWLLANGGTPHVDFWCNYPALGYILTVPYFRFFPDSVYSLLGLRFLMVVLLLFQGLLLARHGHRAGGDRVWGAAPFLLLVLVPAMGRYYVEYNIDHLAALAAVAALFLLFGAPSAGRLAGASALCLLSVLIMPKYAMPLFFCLCGYLLTVAGSSRRVLPAFGAVALGGGLAFLVVWSVFGLSRVSFWNDFLRGDVLITMYNLSVYSKSYPTSLASAVLAFLGRNLILSLLIAAGLAGWFRRAWSSAWHESAAGCGLLLGCLLSLFTFNTELEQYIAPVLVCLCFFVPYASGLVRSPVAKQAVLAAVAFLVLGTAVRAVPAAAGEMAATPVNFRHVGDGQGVAWGPPAIRDLADRERLLRLIPQDEKVIAVWLHSPIFRRDLTFITADERPSFSDRMDTGDPERRYFGTGYLRDALKGHAPAYISITQLGRNYPPGWSEVVQEFLRRESDRYTLLDGVPGQYIRKDLLRRDAGGK